MRRSKAQGLPIRGCRRAAHTGATMVRPQGLGSQAMETHRLQKSQDRRGTKAGRHAASHVARWDRLHLVKQGGGRLENLQEFRKSGSDVPVGTAASARSTETLRRPKRASASSTLIRQRPPTPSCRGLSPYCGENSEPGRYNMESLTSNPRVREQSQPSPEIPLARTMQPQRKKPLDSSLDADDRSRVADKTRYAQFEIN